MADLHPVHPAAAAGTCSPLPDLDAYRTVVFQLINDPDAFWLEVAGRLAWDSAPTTARGPEGQWFPEGQLNLNESCLDRDLFTHGERLALSWRGERGSRSLTLAQLFEQVGTFASGLKMLGVGRGSRVALLLGGIPELVIATLAAARIGATWMPIAPFTRADVLRQRLDDFQPLAVITQDEARVPGRVVPTKAILDQALKADGHSVQFVVVAPHTGGPVGWKMGRDIWWEHSIMGASSFCPPVALPASTPQLVLAGPDGLTEHAIGGLLSYAAWSQAVVMDVRPGRMVAVLHPPHTLTGTALGILATLANGGTIALSETATAALLPAGVDAVMGNLEGLPGVPRVAVVEGGIAGADWAALSAAMPESALVGALSCAGGLSLAAFPPALPGGPGLLGLALPGSRALLLDASGAAISGPAQGRLVIDIDRPGTPPGRHDTGLVCSRDRNGYFTVTD
jgi:acetyl-CoA synthetase